MKPEKPVNLQPKRLTLKQAKRLTRLHGDNSPDALDEKQRIVASCTDWTYEEFDELTMEEFGEVMDAFTQGDKSAEEEAVTPPSGGTSPTGPVESEESPPTG